MVRNEHFWNSSFGLPYLGFEPGIFYTISLFLWASCSPKQFVYQVEILTKFKDVTFFKSKKVYQVETLFKFIFKSVTFYKSKKVQIQNLFSNLLALSLPLMFIALWKISSIISWKKKFKKQSLSTCCHMGIIVLKYFSNLLYKESKCSSNLKHYPLFLWL